MNDTNQLTAEQLEELKEQAFREGWEQGFQYCLSLFDKPIHVPDIEVKDKLSPVDTFLQKLIW